MQDNGAIPGFAARVLGGASREGRLRGYPPPQQQQQAPVRCPRCDSTNTKFCYYNNYNLAQPRHFCKACRRYWTMGGVLRNVPVGGGCRKSKRSSSSSSKPSGGASRKDSASCPSATPRSSSGSSTLDASEAYASASFPNSTLLTSQPNANPATSSDQATANEAPLDLAAEILPNTSTAAAAGSFTGLMPPAAVPAMVDFSVVSDSPPLPPLSQPKAAEEIGSSATELDGMDWPGASVDPALFDISATVDPAAAYWSNGHWGDADPALYLP